MSSEEQEQPEAPAVGQSEWDLLAEIRDLLKQILGALDSSPSRQ